MPEKNDLLSIMILWVDWQLLCSMWCQVVSWAGYSHLESVRLEHPTWLIPWLEFTIGCQQGAPLGLWTRVATHGLSVQLVLLTASQF